MKQKVSIFFPNHHLAYSPTTIHLYDALAPFFDVQIIAPYPSKFNNKELPGYQVNYFDDKAPSLGMKLWALFLFVWYKLIQYKRNGSYVYSYARLKDLLKYEHLFKKAHSNKESYGHIIAVDMIFLKLATKYFKQVHFVSLELVDELLPMLATIPDSKFGSVIIQSEDRYEYLFKGRNLRLFLVQNAPVFEPKTFHKTFRDGRILFNGTASKFFGVFDFLNFLQAMGGKYRGLIKGNVSEEIRTEVNEKYGQLLSEGILEIDDSYTDSNELLDYIGAFEMGICFYNTDLIQENRFNYLTAPSGKMFNYLAAGVPVIGANLPGLKLLESNGCGVLVEDYSAESIEKAVLQIRDRYETYRTNCEVAARKYSFDVMVKPFTDYLRTATNLV